VWRWESLYPKGLSAWDCRNNENPFLYPCRKQSIFTEYFLIVGPIPSPCTVELILSGTHRTGEFFGLINILFVMKQYLY
jgi:hypothetical protein